MGICLTVADVVRYSFSSMGCATHAHSSHTHSYAHCTHTLSNSQADRKSEEKKIFVHGKKKDHNSDDKGTFKFEKEMVSLSASAMEWRNW